MDLKIITFRIANEHDFSDFLAYLLYNAIHCISF